MELQCKGDQNGETRKVPLTPLFNQDERFVEFVKKDKNTLGGLLDLELHTSWTTDMATPPKTESVSGCEEVDQLSYVDHNDQSNSNKKKKTQCVARVLFDTTNNTFFEEDEECVSPAMTRSLIDDDELSPPMTNTSRNSKKSCQRNIRSNDINEHSAGVTLLESSLSLSPTMVSFRKRSPEWCEHTSVVPVSREDCSSFLEDFISPLNIISRCEGFSKKENNLLLSQSTPLTHRRTWKQNLATFPNTSCVNNEPTNPNQDNEKHLHNHTNNDELTDEMNTPVRSKKSDKNKATNRSSKQSPLMKLSDLDPLDVEGDDPISPGLANNTSAKCSTRQSTIHYGAETSKQICLDSHFQNEKLAFHTSTSIKSYLGVAPKKSFEENTLNSYDTLFPCRFSLNDVIGSKPLGNFLYPKNKEKPKSSLDSISIVNASYTSQLETVKKNRNLRSKEVLNTSEKDNLKELSAVDNCSKKTSSKKTSSLYFQKKDARENSSSANNLSATIRPELLDIVDRDIPDENISKESFSGDRQSLNFIKHIVSPCCKIEEKEVSEKTVKSSSNISNENKLESLEPQFKKFSGFQTANGNKIRKAEKALNAARMKLIEGDKTLVSSKKGVGLPGFQTAKGNKVEISEKALNAARMKFVEEDKTLVSSKKGVGFSGFQTAKGNKVEISEKALNAARMKFVEEDKTLEPSKKDVGFSGFQTAKGNKVEISEKALNAARMKFVEEDKTLEPSKKDVGFSGFQTAKGNKVEISEKALNAARMKFVEEDKTLEPSKKDVGFSGFQTAKGNKVEISEKALNAARMKFVEEDKTLEPSKKDVGFSGFQTAKGNKVEISEKALNAARMKFVEEDKTLEPSKKDVGFSGFQTAKGNKVEISEKALNAARMKFVEEDKTLEPSKKDVGFSGFQTAKGNKVEISEKALNSARMKLEEDKTLEPSKKDIGFSGFQTAKGNKVEISEKALNSARMKLEEDKTLEPSKKDIGFSGFQTAKGNKVEISEKALNAARMKLEEDKTLEPSKKDVGFSGFQTAKGNKVEISEKALNAARVKFVEEDNTLEPVRKHVCVEAKRNEVELSDDILDSERHNFINNEDNDPLKLKVGDINANIFPKETKRDVIHGLLSNDRLLNACKRKLKEVTFSNATEYDSDRLIANCSRLYSCGAVFNEEIDKLERLTSLSTDNVSIVHDSDQASRPVDVSDKIQHRELSSMKRKLFSHDLLQQRKKTKIETNEQLMASDFRLVGQMYESKKEAKKSFSEFVNYCCPDFYSEKELQTFGVEKRVRDISGDNAVEYKFNMGDYFTSTDVKKTFKLCDGIMCSCDDTMMIGVQDFKKSLITSDSVEKQLIPEGWVENHYKHIVWKLACYERSYPGLCAKRALTPFCVMHQLKYRYDKEIEKAERSCLKRIFERDELPSWRMVLFVSQLHVTCHSTPNKQQPSAENEEQKDNLEDLIELSDGWYDIRARIDQPLSNLIKQGKIVVGTKLCIWRAELSGITDGCPPLEGLEKLQLVLAANSTRRASWEAKLGYQQQKLACPVPLVSLYADGGTVGVVDVIIVRKYPTQWMEKVDGHRVFRTLHAEEKAKLMYEELKSSKIEELYQNIQSEFETTNKASVKRKRRSYTSKEMAGLRDGKEMYDSIESAVDPFAIENNLSCSQRQILADYKVKKASLLQDRVMQKFQTKWKTICQDEFRERVVVHLQRYRIIDNYTKKNGHSSNDAILTVWKPSNEIMESLQEGTSLKIYNLNTSKSRYGQSSCKFQFSTNNATRYQMESMGAECDKNKYFIPRQVCNIMALYKARAFAYGEVDVVGHVLMITSQSYSRDEVSYLCDTSHMLLAVKFPNGLRAFQVENILQENAQVAFTSLLFGKFAKYSRNVLQLEYTSLSSISCNPKRSYLNDSIKSLCNYINKNGEYLCGMREKLNEECGAKKTKSSSLNKSVPVTEKYSSTSSTRKSMSVAETLPSENLRLRHKLHIKKRLSLERLPDPPNLVALHTNEVPVLNAQFKAPSTVKK